MISKPNVARIIRNGDLNALQEAMRFAPDAQVRQEAVRASASLSDYELVEILNRALREDPDEGVRREARTALEEILGNRANEVISSYEGGEAYEDEWLQGPPEEIEEGEAPEGDEITAEWDPITFTTRFSHQPNPARLAAEKDLDGLTRAMRYGPDASVRRQAAEAAGKLGNYDLIEPLTRSVQEDPDEDVSYAAYTALHEMLGKRAEEVLSGYAGKSAYGDEWIITEEVGEVEEDPESEPDPDAYVEDEPAMDREWDENSIAALYTMANDDRDVDKGAKAVRALAQIGTTRSVEALISLALHSPIPPIQEEARAELEAYYGDDLDEVLSSYSGAGEGVETDEDGEDEEADAAPEAAEWMPLAEEGASLRQTPRDTPSTLQEEGVNAIQVIIVAICVLVVIGLVSLALR